MGEGRAPVEQIPRVWTLRGLAGRDGLWGDPGLGCAACLGFLGHMSIHPLGHSDLHVHPTAQLCARAMFQALRQVPGLPFRSWGAGGGGLRNHCGFYSGFVSVGSRGQMAEGQGRALGPHPLPRPSRPRP